MTTSLSGAGEDAALDRAHRLRRMTGRDPDQTHRSATPLELLFDLTFVVAFSFAGNAVAHAFAEGHWRNGLIGFGIALFAIVWAWINYSWFASAFDTDDWLFRVTTGVQMVGVVIFALGIPTMFASLEEGRTLDNRVMVAGYVVMRLAMLAQWLRAARQCSGALRRTCLIYAATLTIAQLGWVLLIIVNLSIPVTVGFVVAMVIVELLGPILGERNAPTPWHADHIAERYSLLAIVALGEGIVGAAVSLSAAVEATGWDWQTVLIAITGVGLTVAMWWVYFLLPSSEVLERNRAKAFVWGYGHYFVFGSIAAVGAGLHVVGYYLEHKAHISEFAAVLTVVIPVGVYVLSIVLLTSYLVGRILPTADVPDPRARLAARPGGGGGGRRDARTHRALPGGGRAGAGGRDCRVRGARIPGARGGVDRRASDRRGLSSRQALVAYSGCSAMNRTTYGQVATMV